MTIGRAAELELESHFQHGRVPKSALEVPWCSLPPALGPEELGSGGACESENHHVTTFLFAS